MRDNFCDFLCSVILAFPGYFLLKFFPFACLHTVPLPWEKGSALKGKSLLPKWTGGGGGGGGRGAVGGGGGGADYFLLEQTLYQKGQNQF